ncbi:MAG: class I tRNA ligase family protein [Caldisericia bacterium]
MKKTISSKLSNYRDKLLKYFDEHPDFVLPKKRYNEVYSVLKEGLRDVSFSRTGKDWGIRVPFDDKHTIYVWGDALVNYLTGLTDDTEIENIGQQMFTLLEKTSSDSTA